MASTLFDLLPENVIESICNDLTNPKDIVNFILSLGTSLHMNLTVKRNKRKKRLNLCEVDEGVCENESVQRYVNLNEHLVLRSPRQLYEFKTCPVRPFWGNLQSLIINDEPLDTWINFPLTIPQLKHLKVKLTHIPYIYRRQQQQLQQQQRQQQQQYKKQIVALNTNLLNFAADSLCSLDLTLVHDTTEEDCYANPTYHLDLNNLVRCEVLRLTIPCRHKLTTNQSQYVVMCKSVQKCLVWIAPESRVRSIDIDKCPKLEKLAIFPLRCVGESYKSKKILRTSARSSSSSSIYDQYIHSIKKFKSLGSYNDDAISESPYHKSKKQRLYIPNLMKNITTFFITRHRPHLIYVYFYYNQLNDYSRFRTVNYDCRFSFIRIMYNELHRAMRKLTTEGFFKYG